MAHHRLSCGLTGQDVTQNVLSVCKWCETMKRKTREKQYNIMLEKAEQSGLSTFGLMTNQAWDDDPKRLAFTFSRYKFVAKMMSGKQRVLEIGCADAHGVRVRSHPRSGRSPLRQRLSSITQRTRHRSHNPDPRSVSRPDSGSTPEYVASHNPECEEDLPS